MTPSAASTGTAKGYSHKVSCPICGDEMEFVRDTGDAKPPFPQDWFFDVAHEHGKDGETRSPIWRGIIYHRSARGRYPEMAKEVRETQKENRRAKVAKARMSNATHGSGPSPYLGGAS